MAIAAPLVAKHACRKDVPLRRADILVDAPQRHGRHSVGRVISPVLANVYPHRLDRCWAERGHGRWRATRMTWWCRATPKREAEAALAALRSVLAELGLELKAAKTRIAHLREGGEGLDFLGFHHRRVRGDRGNRHLRFLARWPRERRCKEPATGSARSRTSAGSRSGRSDRAGPQPVPARLGGLLPIRKLRLHCTRITTHALRRLALFAAKRHTRASGYGMTIVAYLSPDRMALINLDRLVVTLSPSGTGGPSRMPAVEGVGEPCAGEPHARIDVATGGNWRSVGYAARTLAPPADPPVSRASSGRRGVLLSSRGSSR